MPEFSCPHCHWRRRPFNQRGINDHMRQVHPKWVKRNPHSFLLIQPAPAPRYTSYYSSYTTSLPHHGPLSPLDPNDDDNASVSSTLSQSTVVELVEHCEITAMMPVSILKPVGGSSASSSSTSVEEMTRGKKKVSFLLDDEASSTITREQQLEAVSTQLPSCQMVTEVPHLQKILRPDCNPWHGAENDETIQCPEGSSSDFPLPPSWLVQYSAQSSVFTLGSPQATGTSLVDRVPNLTSHFRLSSNGKPSPSSPSTFTEPPRLSITTSGADITSPSSQLPIAKSPVRSRSRAAQFLSTLSLTAKRRRKSTSFYFSESSESSDSGSECSYQESPWGGVVSSILEEEEKEPADEQDSEGSVYDGSVDITDQTPLLTPIYRSEEEVSGSASLNDVSSRITGPQVYSARSRQAEQATSFVSRGRGPTLTTSHLPAYSLADTHRAVLHIRSPASHTPSDYSSSSTLLGEPVGLLSPRRALPRLTLRTTHLAPSTHSSRNARTARIRYNASFPSFQYNRPSLSFDASSFAPRRACTPDGRSTSTSEIGNSKLSESDGDTSFETGLQSPYSPDLPSAIEMLPAPPASPADHTSGSEDGTLLDDAGSSSPTTLPGQPSPESCHNPLGCHNSGGSVSVPHLVAEPASPPEKQEASFPPMDSVPTTHDRESQTTGSEKAAAPADAETAQKPPNLIPRLMINNGPIPRLPLNDMSPIASRLPPRHSSKEASSAESSILGIDDEGMNQEDLILSETFLVPVKKNVSGSTSPPSGRMRSADTSSNVSPLLSSVSTLPLTSSPFSGSNKSWCGLEDQVEANTSLIKQEMEPQPPQVFDGDTGAESLSSSPRPVLYPKMHCRACLKDPAEELTATMCGHLFCYSCITEAVMRNSRCPTCSAPCLLYCLFRLDLSG